MKTYNKLLLSALTAAAATVSAGAVPAKPGIINVVQSDGTELPVRLMGDERHHITLSEDGYLLASKNNIYYYADVDESGTVRPTAIRATEAGMRDGVARKYLQGIDMQRNFERLNAAAARESMRKSGAKRGPGLFEGTHFPAMGDQKAVVILVEYTDVKMTLTDAYDYFNRMLNERGFSDYGGTGSAVDFFMESSMGQFRPQFDVFGPVTLDHNMAYYGGNDWYGNDKHPEEMIIEACQKLDSTVDFSEYDRDGDGYIDNVFVFYAGRGEASGGSSDTVWPHSWDVSSATSVPYYFDGVRLDRYGCTNEYEGSRPDGVGTFVHEFSHVMGLPDLYATSYTSAFTPGAWSALDYGPYNNNGCTPPLYSAFERYALNWIEPLPIEGALNATLYPIGTNQAGIIRTQSANEFFLVENRQQTSWDTYIPGHGMLVWHIDYNASVWASNKVNNTSSHQYVDIEEADGTQSDYSRDGDSFPGASGKTSFTDDTKPGMKTWSGKSLGLPITDIAESAEGVITFKVCGGREPMQPISALEADEITADSFIASWESAGEGAQYVLRVYTRAESRAADGGDKVYLAGYEAKRIKGATSCRVSGLEPETDYFYTVAVGDGWEESLPSEEIAVFTGRLPLNRRAVTATEATDVEAESFTASWLPLEDADTYLINVYTKEFGAPLENVCDFTDGVDALPEGWTTNTGASYANSSYSGAAVPALRLSISSDALTTPEFKGGVRGLRFWHRGNGTAPDDRLRVYGLKGKNWTPVAEFEITTAKGGATIEVAEAEIPAGTTQLRVEFARTGTKGAVAIDDVAVLYGETYAAVDVPGYTAYNAGSQTSCTIDGLMPETAYYYTVTALGSDGQTHSLPSQEIAVRTQALTGIADTEGDSIIEITAGNGCITVAGAEGLMLTIASIDGKLFCSGPAESSVTVAVPTGIYIVKAGEKVVKTIVR